LRRERKEKEKIKKNQGFRMVRLCRPLEGSRDSSYMVMLASAASTVFSGFVREVW
jgi:hypothetical protein